MRIKLFFLLGFVLGFGACKNFKEVQCTGVSGFKVNKIDPKGMDADIFLQIKNPNNTGFSIYRSEFDVSYNGIHLGKAKLNKRVHIRANAEESYAFNLKGDFKNVNLMDVMKLVNGMSGRGMLEVTGDLKAGKFLIRKKFPVALKERLSL